jgi:signal transduction histidine kinase
MSHDLKTPITRMRLRAEMLDNEELRDKFEKDLLEMQAMVGEALDYMRGLSDREPEQPVDIMALLQGLQADYRDMGKRMRLEGTTNSPVRGVARLLKRCIGNLVDNAVSYGEHAEVSVEDDGAGVTIRVRDDGPGIPERELEAVFDPFYRLDASRSRATGGTGLGLSIARNIARAHGGEVRLRNRAQLGLEAIVTLMRR